MFHVACSSCEMLVKRQSLFQPVISTSIGLQVPLLHPGAEQAEMPTIRSIFARNRTNLPGRESGGAILMAPEGRIDAFIKKLNGVGSISPVTPKEARFFAKFSKQLGCSPWMPYVRRNISGLHGARRKSCCPPYLPQW